MPKISSAVHAIQPYAWPSAARWSRGGEVRELVERVAMSWTPREKRGQRRMGRGERGRRSCRDDGRVERTEVL